ncbi:MAG: hypothetical protein Q7V17_13810 [Afipia sp.]|nr:hypothetical protein [Afipia sp.]
MNNDHGTTALTAIKAIAANVADEVDAKRVNYNLMVLTLLSKSIAEETARILDNELVKMCGDGRQAG